MARPDDIAAHIWAEAERLAKEDGYLSLESSYDRAQYCRAARKVLAERERCAMYIERRPGEMPDRQHLADAIRRGDTYDAHGRFVPGGHQ